MRNTILLRDNMSDTGTVPSRGSWYSSPDLIVHDQVSNPQTYFKETYDKDVSMALQTGSKTNLIYARVKNIGTEPIRAYIHAYACLSSLFLNPTKWEDSQLKSVSGRDYVVTGLIQPGEVGVGEEPFLFNAQKNTSYCHTVYAMTSALKPDYPSEFKDYDDYVSWIRGCTHVAARNHTKVNSAKSSYEQIDEFSNPSKLKSRVSLFLIRMTAGFPVGTKIIVNCEPLGIVAREHFVADSTKELSFTESGIVPPGFEGYVKTAVFLPAGRSWPLEGVISVETFVNVAKDSIAAPHVVDLNSRPILLKANLGKLIQVGTCSTEFI